MTVTRSNFDLRANSLYETPEWATMIVLERLRSTLHQTSVVWEPAAGNHKMVKEIKRYFSIEFEGLGPYVAASDIVEYDLPHQFLFDFTSAEPSIAVIDHFLHIPGPVSHLITNPPYGHSNALAALFARRALDLLPEAWIALLLPVKFDSASGRKDLFRDCPRFHGKITLLDRLKFFEGEFDGTEDHAWFVWKPESSVAEINIPVLTWAENPEKAAKRKK